MFNYRILSKYIVVVPADKVPHIIVFFFCKVFMCNVCISKRECLVHLVNIAIKRIIHVEIRHMLYQPDKPISARGPCIISLSYINTVNENNSNAERESQISRILKSDSDLDL